MQKEEREYAGDLILKMMELRAPIDEAFIEYAIDVRMRRKPKLKVEFQSPLKEENIQE